MCLTYFKSSFEEKTAEHNILVCKVLSRKNLIHRQAQFYEFAYRRFKLNRLGKSLKINSKYSNRDIIEEGFHACINPFWQKLLYGKDSKTSYMVIPKGATYYVGYDNDSRLYGYKINSVVANEIIYVGQSTWLTRLILKFVYKAKELDC